MFTLFTTSSFEPADWEETLLATIKQDSSTVRRLCFILWHILLCCCNWRRHLLYVYSFNNLAKTHYLNIYNITNTYVRSVGNNLKWQNSIGLNAIFKSCPTVIFRNPYFWYVHKNKFCEIGTDEWGFNSVTFFIIM